MSMKTGKLDEALSDFQQCLGSENVLFDQSTLKTYETATFKTERKIPAVVKPSSTEEIQQCLRIANTYKIPIYTISTGKNVGYGSRVPSCDNAIVMELSRMDSIADFNEDLGYVTLEPGVTQEQLFQFLKDQNSNLWMDATGSFTSHSLIGNIADRGFGHTIMADHFGSVGGMQVVLPTGEVVQTGLGRFDNAKARGVYRWGLGPYVDGLFTQSNLGVITQVTLWLMPAPQCYEKFFFSVEHEEQLPELIDLLRPLRLNGTLRSAMHIGNDYKVFGSMQQYPWEETSGETPLSREVMDRLSEKWDFGAWNVSGALYGTKTEVKNARKAIRRQLRGKVKSLRFLNEGLLSIADKIKKPYQWITGVNLDEMLKVLRPVMGLTKGVPTNEFIPSTYWRKKIPAPAPDEADPDADGCGLIWVAPIAPTGGVYAKELWDIVKTTLLKHSFEPSVSITLLTERAMDCVINIAFDRSVEGEDERALVCHDELLQRLTESGYYPYRLSLASMELVNSDQSNYMNLMRGVKELVDPAGILSPGRYGI